MMRWAEHRDLEAIVEVLKCADDLFFPPLSSRRRGIEERVMEVLNDENSGYLLFEEDGKCVGVAGYTLGKNGREGAYINMLCVVPHAQGKGIGGCMLDSLEQRLYEMGVRSAWVCTWSTNERALTLYLRRGYTIERIMEHHRARDVHTIVLSKPLGGMGDG
ncbi:GNAT family N-acetyltransferase [Methermicoccus shengliensis]|uniref:GNAT family N-acetyltransferase n=1 Tax=Methermicoccus shengliensis TaxID=660064 RepID=A0A832RVU0_9EURY|nr:GNAT family N-acetyltransferase [Methermicoccus shengliensis]KUK04234.1 MAG: Ribosomal-protein-alanine acetyltransferase [Euryarchaeota archaeon 55_53]KUK29879.1 MAG: Ribosomal-protein-alanine acetyltransferase [Methanosarcinales archeaon 56_1174]MDI3488275.1 hypothetical protein [Methanosarcinales archaeon]MDN5295812.1 hypothetical protein [Methanosarcinales archaeon]HIH69266.1 GNAT family N-acetyltransferase [Methermicoccus shengliensis]